MAVISFVVGWEWSKKKREHLNGYWALMQTLDEKITQAKCSYIYTSTANWVWFVQRAHAWWEKSKARGSGFVCFSTPDHEAKKAVNGLHCIYIFNYVWPCLLPLEVKETNLKPLLIHFSSRMSLADISVSHRPNAQAVYPVFEL